MSERYCILCIDGDVSCLEAGAQDHDAQLQLAAKDSKRAADLASIRFRNGATGLLDLLDAQRAQLKDEDAYAESHSNSALSAVLLYKSLAGDGLNILLNRRKA
jgi:multidrug efflux system outer membrane protein